MFRSAQHDEGMNEYIEGIPLVDSPFYVLRFALYTLRFQLSTVN